MSDVIKNIMSKMRDDKGLFQGGRQGRIFGRVKDAAESFAGKFGKSENESSPVTSSGGSSYGPNISDDVRAWADNPTAQGLKQLKYARAHGGEEGILDRIEGIRTGRYDIGEDVSNMGFKDIVKYAETSYMDEEGNFQTSEYPGFHYGYGIGDGGLFSDDDYDLISSAYDEFRKDPKFYEEFSGGRIYDRDADETVGGWEDRDKYLQLSSDAMTSRRGKPSYDQPYMTQGKYGMAGRGGQYTADELIDAFEGKSNIMNIVDGLHDDSPVLRDKYQFPETRYATKQTQDERQLAFQEAFDEQMELYNKLGKKDPRIEEAGY